MQLLNTKEIKQALQREERTRANAVNLAALDPETVSAGHRPQFDLLQDTAERVIALCSRRAGKSVAVCSKLAYTASKHPNSVLIYFGATGKSVRALIWEPVWQTFRKKWGVGGVDNETMMFTRFGNGSMVWFVGTDDFRHVETFLGGKLRGVAIDEAQSQPNSVLEPLVTRILPPSLSDQNGWLMLSGTIPEVEAGLFYNIYNSPTKYPSWSRHNWNRFANPHIESVEALRKELINSARTIDDPLIRRDWFGEFVFSHELTAFRYNRAVAGYDGNWPRILDTFAFGVDPGTRDRTAIVLWGWSQTLPTLYHVAEWVTKKNSATTLSDIARNLRDMRNEIQRINPLAGFPYWYIDMGGSQMAVDTFGSDYGLPVIHAAKKTDRRMQVERLSDLLARGKAKIRIGSSLEEDLSRAQWDKDARADGKYEWSSAWHPDVADAGRYGAQGYFDAYKAKPPQEDALTHMARIEADLWKRDLQPPNDEPWKTDLDVMGYRHNR